MFSLKKSFTDLIVCEAMVSLANPYELAALFRRLGWRVIFACFPKKVKLASKLQILNNFKQHLFSMVRHHGALYVVKYLKACTLAIQKCISKDQFKSLREIEPDLPLPRLTRSGLPQFIPLKDRRAICSGNKDIIRFYLTLFSLFRVIKVEGKLKTSTITDPFSGDLSSLLVNSSNLKVLSSKLVSQFNMKEFYKPQKLYPFEKASPTHGSSWMGLWRDAYTLKNKFPSIFTSILNYLSITKQDRLKTFLIFFSDLFPSYESNISLMGKHGQPENIGQLSTKEEAAGKIRVFALVDFWTQTIMSPLHDLLFNFLAKLPNDGTFDQDNSVKRVSHKSLVYEKSYCYDLTAATDRLPIEIQVSILEPIIGSEAAQEWRKILVGRPYVFQESEFYYSVGQPMGARSSWAMLALTHHLIVQMAYLQSREIPLYFFLKKEGYMGISTGWFDAYEVLGDDIVIFDSLTAQQYLKILESLGAGINLHKSIIAKTSSFEFAKRSYLHGVDVSAIPWKMFISNNSLLGRVSVSLSLLKRGFVSEKIVSYFQRINSKFPSVIGDEKSSLLGFASSLLSSKLLSHNNLLKLMYNGNFSKKVTKLEWFSSINVDLLRKLVSDYSKGNYDFTVPNSDNFNREFQRELIWINDIAKKSILLAHTLKQKNLIEDFTNLLINAFTWEGKTLIPDYCRTLWPTWSMNEREIEWQTLYMSFYMISQDFLPSTDFLDELSPQSIMRLSLDEQVELLERLESIETIFRILDRAIEKRKGEIKPKKIVSSPLKILKLVFSSSRIRPNWTFRSNT